jgi:transcriptional regulator with XRE-family HTH domain
MNKIKIGERLRARRMGSGWTQKEAGQRLHLTQQYVGELEQGKKTPAPWETLMRICAVYGCSADWLLGLPDAPAPPQASLPEGGAEMLALMAGLSARPRGELLAMARALHAFDQESQRTVMLSNAIAALGGEELLNWLQSELTARTARLGSAAAAMAELRALLETSLAAEEAAEEVRE